MSHRVIQVDSKVSNSEQADKLQTEITNKLDSKNYSLHRRQVNDGQDLDGTATLAVKTDHDKDSEANKFYNWLWNWAQTNQATFDTDGSVATQGFTRFRIQVHDCKHLETINEKENQLHKEISNVYPELNQQDISEIFANYEFDGADFGKDCQIENANKFDLRRG